MLRIDDDVGQKFSRWGCTLYMLRIDDDVTLLNEESLIFRTCNGVLSCVSQRIQTFLTARTGCAFSLSSFKVYSDQGRSLPLFYLKQRGINR